MEYGRPHDHPELGRSRAPRGAPFQNEMIGEEMDSAAQPAPPLPVRNTLAVEAVGAFECLDDVVHSPPRTMHPNKRPADWFIWSAHRNRLRHATARCSRMGPRTCENVLLEASART